MFPLSLLVAVILFLELGSARANPTDIPLNAYRQEADMLSLALDRRVLQNLPVWDAAVSSELRAARGREVFDDTDIAPILILHLWATWCGPCKTEFATWKTLKTQIYNLTNGRVRVAHIAMQNDATDVAEFVRQLGDKMPSVPLYVDRGGKLAKNLSHAFDEKSLPPLPVTIWLDPDRVVRRVIVGSTDGRIDEVKGASMRMLRLLEQQEKSGRRPKPKDVDEYDALSQ